MPLQRQPILLLMHQEDWDHVHIQRLPRLLEGGLRPGTVVGIGLGGHQQIRPLLQRQSKRLISIIILRRVKQIDSFFRSVKKNLRAAFRRKILLQGTHGQRTDGQG